ncbi:unnamed protein product [Trichogramma brassicae]|uniref:Uncharacterized protein n=1 Tax=Trichogramma brassicae TaxID=86971 RepID=A0A6H5IE30_9HYME|nr:unnamed protein product [Trichogramma brassicae]
MARSNSEQRARCLLSRDHRVSPRMLALHALARRSNWSRDQLVGLRSAREKETGDSACVDTRILSRTHTHLHTRASLRLLRQVHMCEFSRFVFFAWCGRACARGGRGTTQKEDPGYVISLRSGKKTPITVRAGSDSITISRSSRRGLTKLAIDGAQYSHDEVRSENHTHKRAPDAGAKAQLERMMAPEARTTLTR